MTGKPEHTNADIEGDDDYLYAITREQFSADVLNLIEAMLVNDRQRARIIAEQLCHPSDHSQLAYILAGDKQ